VSPLARASERHSSVHELAVDLETLSYVLLVSATSCDCSTYRCASFCMVFPPSSICHDYTGVTPAGYIAGGVGYAVA
jgi:hypothetical protein